MDSGSRYDEVAREFEYGIAMRRDISIVSGDGFNVGVGGGLEGGAYWGNVSVFFGAVGIELCGGGGGHEENGLGFVAGSGAKETFKG